MEKYYFSKLAQVTSGTKHAQYRGRAIFCKVAYEVLRNSNSSSILERSFGDCLRAVTDRRVNLRDV